MPSQINKETDAFICPSIKYKNELKNLHLVDWYFSWRLEQFSKIFFDQALEAKWRWNRYE